MLLFLHTGTNAHLTRLPRSQQAANNYNSNSQTNKLHVWVENYTILNHTILYTHLEPQLLAL